jgi:hypothetical protein
MQIWQGADGKVRLDYVEPNAPITRYAVTGKDEVFKTMAGALATFAKAAAGEEWLSSFSVSAIGRRAAPAVRALSCR